MKNVACFISYLFHPLLMPLYGLFFIFNSDSIFSLIPVGARLYCYIVTLLSMLFIPVLGILVLKKTGLVRSYGLTEKQDRIYPALIGIFGAFLGFYLIGKVGYTNIVQQLYLVLIIVLAGFSIITTRWKMSMHMTAAGAVCGFLAIIGLKYWGEVQGYLMLMLVFSGILAACRLYLKKHNPTQIYVGFLFGLIFVIVILY